MEDFGFKLQNIKSKSNLKNTIRILLILLSVLIFIVIVVKIIKSLTRETDTPVENIVLIKSPVQEIKREPTKEGGLDIGNLDISVYDIIDNNSDNNSKPIIKKTEQSIDIKEQKYNNEQDLLSEKINDISENEEIKTDIIVTDMENKANSKTKSNVNISINNNQKPKTDLNDLKKLGNNALITNLKAKKDIKPGIKVQLLALKSRDGLTKYWNEISTKYDSLFSDKGYYIEKVNLGGADSIYRLQVGNFDSEDSATKFCKEYIRVTNKSKVDCIVAKDK